MSALLDRETREVVTTSLRELFATPDVGLTVLDLLSDLGWGEVVQADAATATTLLFHEQGRALASTRLLDDVVLGALSMQASRTAVLHPLAPAAPHSGFVGRGVVLAPLDDIETVVVPSCDGVRVVPAGVVAAQARAARGFDPDAGWLVVDSLECAEPVVDAPGICAIAAGHRALAAEILGVCQGALDLATQHTTHRTQYGRPLGSFQAVRHQLAEAHVAIEGAQVTLEAAWAVADSEVGAWAARLAKQQAGRAQALVLRRTVQVMGAMGLTLESDMHRYVSRGASLDLVLGGHLRLAQEIGQVLVSGGTGHRVSDI